MQEAFDDINNVGKNNIYILRDFDITTTQTLDSNIEANINLNGYNINCLLEGVAIKNKGTMSISGNGSIVLSNESYSKEAYVLNNGTNAILNLQDINISTTGYAIAIYNSGKVTSSVNKISSELSCIYNYETGSLNITGGQIVGLNSPASTISNSGEAVIDAGNLEGTLNNYGEFILNAGNINDTNGIGVMNKKNMEINGGYINTTTWILDNGVLDVRGGKTSSVIIGKYLGTEAEEGTKPTANVCEGETGYISITSKGTLTLGEDTELPASSNTPLIKSNGGDYTIEAESGATINFYDGTVTGAKKAFFVGVPVEYEYMYRRYINLPQVDKSTEYTIKFTTENNIETATVGVYMSPLPEGFEYTEGNGIKNITDGNEFVWIPLYEVGDFKTPLNEAYEYLNYGPYYQDGENFRNYASDMYENVLKYGGFYIGKYESSMENDTLVIKKNLRPANLTFYSAMTHAQSLYTVKNAKEIKKNDNSKLAAVSTLVYGTQWDAVEKYIARQSISADNYEKFGNFTATIKNTGSSEQYNTRGIYDIIGNLPEWTMENEEFIQSPTEPSAPETSGSGPLVTNYTRYRYLTKQKNTVYTEILGNNEGQVYHEINLGDECGGRVALYIK